MPAGPQVPLPAFQFALQAGSHGEGDLTQSAAGRLLPPPPTSADLAGKEAVGFTAGVFGLGEKKREKSTFFKNTLAV